MNKPFTYDAYDEHITDADYRPLPGETEKTYVLFVLEENSIVRWASGPIREDLEALARDIPLSGWWVAEEVEV